MCPGRILRKHDSVDATIISDAWSDTDETDTDETDTDSDDLEQIRAVLYFITVHRHTVQLSTTARWWSAIFNFTTTLMELYFNNAIYNWFFLQNRLFIDNIARACRNFISKILDFNKIIVVLRE